MTSQTTALPEPKCLTNSLPTRESRAAEMKMKNEIKSLRDKLEAQKKTIARWEKKYQKKVMIVQNHKKKIHALSNELSYCKEVMDNIRVKLHDVKNFKEKELINKVLNNSFAKRRRAPRKSFSFYNYHYKNKTNQGNEQSRKFKERSKRIRKVINFYLKDENSCVAPGANDVITKKKKRMRKRYLTDTIGNLYLKFCKESEGGHLIGRATFYKLRPFWVVKMKISERNTCLCKKHSNFNFLFDRLKYHKVIDALSVQDYIDKICCNSGEKSCMYGQCDACKDNQVIQTGDGEDTV